MTTKITLDALCVDSVTVLITKVFVEDGEEYSFPPHAKAYYNSKQDREKLKNDVPEQYYNAVISIWGETPTIVVENDED